MYIFLRNNIFDIKIDRRSTRNSLLRLSGPDCYQPGLF